MESLQVNLKHKTYQVHIKRGITKELGKHLRAQCSGEKVAIITDKNVYHIYGKQVLQTLNSEGFETHVIAIEPGEKSKTLATLNDVFGKLVRAKLAGGT